MFSRLVEDITPTTI